MGIITSILLGKDQYYFNNLDDIHKLAFCKLISEVVKKDGVVISEEFDELPEIPKSFMANSNSLTLEEAINHLKSVPPGIKDFIKESILNGDITNSYDEAKELMIKKGKNLGLSVNE